MDDRNEPPMDDVLLSKFREYRSLRPRDPEDRVWASVAEAFDMNGDGKRTLAALERAKDLNPEWGRHRLQLAKCALRARHWMRAIQEIEACADLESSGCDTSFYAENELYYLGYALFNARRYKEAAEAWRGADNVIQYWRNPEPLKEFHLHRGFAHHLEGDFLDAIEAYRRGLVAPGPGDTSEDDVMDHQAVEDAQDMNDRIEPFYLMAKAGETPDASALEAVPYTT